MIPDREPVIPLPKISQNLSVLPWRPLYQACQGLISVAAAPTTRRPPTT